VNNRLSICILLCLAILASGQAAAQGTFGTKVQAGDPDVGLPLSPFSLFVGVPPQGLFSQVSYWDIGTTPGFYDDQDVTYLQFGNGIGPFRLVRANNIRLTGWGTYLAGSYVKPSDSDIGQQLMPLPAYPSVAATGFWYMDVAGGPGYDMADPVYFKAISTPALQTETNDIRITANAGFPAGSRVSLNDPDAGKPLSAIGFKAVNLLGAILPTASIPTPIAGLSFFNANGNIMAPPASQAIYDDGDVVYFDVNPIGWVSPNDIRLY
jgi:hypothetical protein